MSKYVVIRVAIALYSTINSHESPWIHSFTNDPPMTVESQAGRLVGSSHTWYTWDQAGMFLWKHTLVYP